MRTTVTLDDDVAAELTRRARRTGEPFKKVINDAIRAGLRGGRAAARPYRLEPQSLGGVTGGADLDRALRLADALEDDAIAAKLEQRK